MTTTLELTPALTSMRVLVISDEAVYVRLPEELQRPAMPELPGNCTCRSCKGETPGAWDTLVVPTLPAKHAKHALDWTYTVHMPDESVDGFREYLKAKGKLVR